MNLRDVYQRVYVVNLDRRRDRYQEFLDRLPADWPFGRPVRAPAVDGKLCPQPSWWKHGAGAWGCYRSHVRCIETCLNEGVDSVLLLEDDAVCCADFAASCRAFFQAVPDDWGMVYLGGQHLKHDTPPQRVNDQVWIPYNLNRTHAWSLRGPLMRKVYRYLCASDWPTKHHIDFYLGEFHQRREDPIYVPGEWLIGQAEGKSNISAKNQPEHFWRGAANIAHRSIPSVVAVVGQFRGGTSCVAGILHNLGVSMGRQLMKPGKANPYGFFEALPLARTCRRAFKEPWLKEQIPYRQRVAQLRAWAEGRHRHGRVIGAKHPTLCLMIPDIAEAWPELRIVAVERPAAESEASIARHNWGWPPEARQTVLRNMIATRDAALPAAKVPVCRLPFREVLADPPAAVDRLIEFAEISPTPEQRAAALAHVRTPQ